MNTASLVQISLFDRGSAVKQAIADSIAVRETVKKDKNKAVVKNTKGEAIVTSRTIQLMPRKSETKEDLADLTGFEGQALMLFEQEARQQLLESASSHMMKLIASGNYTFDRARVSANGKFALAIKPAIGKAAILSEADLTKQAEALGFKLVPTGETPAPVATEPTGETELVIAPKDAKAAAKAKSANVKVATAPAK